MFVCIGVYSTNNDFFEVWETLVVGLIGYVLLYFEFHPAPILLGFVLGPRMEENFRRALQLSRGSLWVFVDSPICAAFLLVIAVLLAGQIYFRLRRRNKSLPAFAEMEPLLEEMSQR
jgi:TctA family transporter